MAHRKIELTAPPRLRRAPPPTMADGPIRWLGFAPGGPAQNMALDRALLHHARTPAIRLYAWTPPGVSLGWFQRDVDATRFEDAGYEVVRRVTGGGAVVHHHEVTYSAVLPLAHPLFAGRSIVESYDVLHAPIRAALLTFGIETAPHEVELRDRAADEPVLCFERTSPFDIRWRGRKIVGSAQRRLPDRVLQHGSIILEPNPLQPGQPSLSRIAGRAILLEEMAAALERAFNAAFGPLPYARLTPDEEAALALERDLES